MSQLLLLLLFLLHISFSTSNWNENGDVLVLNNKNFPTETKKQDVLLIMFYVTWCPHCQHLHPNYERAATELLKNTDPSIQIAKFDCTDDHQTQCGRKYSIQGYPSLRIYRFGKFRGEELNYRNRTSEEIVKTMKALKKDSQFRSPQLDGYEDGNNHAKITQSYPGLIFGGLIVLFFFSMKGK